jgi:UDP-GlcNAc3NAcA epimerase
MLKIVTIIGARPQIIKAAALSRVIQKNYKNSIKEVIVHTGQHYDTKMSQVFIDELNIPVPNYNFGVGSSTHGAQTGKMIREIEEILFQEYPDYVIIYGDTNSTLAGAIAASKMNIPVLHVEAGLRSFNKSMPEEINRIMADHVSTILFTPTQTGLDNLVKEGFSATTSKPFTQDNPGLLHCGDVMYDNSLYFKKLAFEKSTVLKDYKLKNKEFILCTVHRDNNTDDAEHLNSIFSTLNELSLENKVEIVMPLHPRTSRAIEESLDNKVDEAMNKNLLFKLLPPVSFLDMIMLESQCQMAITDSGGVQKEAFFFKKPSIILRSETEWKEIVDAGVGIVTDVKRDQILDAFAHFKLNASELEYPSIFGDGNAAGFICQTILNNK